MIRLTSTGEVRKDDGGQLCLKSAYDVEVLMNDVTSENIEEQVTKFRAALNNYFKSITITT